MIDPIVYQSSGHNGKDTLLKPGINGDSNNLETRYVPAGFAYHRYLYGKKEAMTRLL